MAKQFKINAQSDEIENSLTQLYALIQKEGGEIHPAVTIQQVGNDISILSLLGTGSREPVFKIPQHCLPDQGHFSMVAKGSEFEISRVADACPPLERDIQERMIEIYNLTGKIDAQRQVDPKLALREDLDLLKLLYRARPDKMDFLKEFEERPENYYALKGFLVSRILRHTSGKPGDKTERPYLMPFVDYLNHHPQGAPYRLQSAADSQGWLVSPNCRPVENSKECFACYGEHYDLLDIYLSYNFIDSRAPAIGLRSVPVTLHFEGLGIVTVGTATSGAIKGELPQNIQDLRFWLPTMHRPGKGQLRASHLLLPHGGAPFALRRVLATMIINLGGQPEGVGDERLVAAEKQVLEHNEQHYRALEAAAASREVTDANRTVLESIALLCARQLRVLSDYRDNLSRLAQ